jgi:glyoxylase I family protein
VLLLFAPDELDTDISTSQIAEYLGRSDMNIMKLDSIIVFVPDFDQARAFYSGVLGFAAIDVGEGHMVFESGGIRLVAFKCDKPGSVGDYSREARAVFAFGVRSVEDSMRMLREQGVEFLHEVPAEGPMGRYAAFVDPFGIVHELQESPVTEAGACDA